MEKEAINAELDLIKGIDYLRKALDIFESLSALNTQVSRGPRFKNDRVLNLQQFQMTEECNWSQRNENLCSREYPETHVVSRVSCYSLELENNTDFLK